LLIITEFREGVLHFGARWGPESKKAGATPAFSTVHSCWRE
jgi:hypothetical protein